MKNDFLHGDFKETIYMWPPSATHLNRPWKQSPGAKFVFLFFIFGSIGSVV